MVTESGRALDADLVVLGTGAVPDVMLARSAGLELGESGGVRCSESARDLRAGLWAAGDLCEYESVLHGKRMRIEHFEVAAAQGAAAAPRDARQGRPFDEVPYFWSDLADWARWSTSAPRRVGPRGRARLARRRRVHDLLPGRRRGWPRR